MANKPTKLPDWATGGTNTSEPTSGEKITGWPSGGVVVSSYLNWLAKTTRDWLEYVKDGAFAGASSFADLVTFTSGLTVGANAHVTVSGTGQYKHGDRTLWINHTEFEADTTSTQSVQLGYMTGFGAPCHIQASVPLPAGKRIKSAQFFYQVDTANCQPQMAKVSRTAGAGSWARADICSGPEPGGTPGTLDSTGTTTESQTLVPNNGSYTIVAGEHLVVTFINTAGTPSGLKVHGVLITYDEP